MPDQSTRPSSTTEHTLPLPQPLPYRAIAEWQLLYEREKPIAEMFHVTYLATGDLESATRPVTFVLNGGPGAASAYLHMGALGPKRIQFGENGSLPKPPVKLVDNLESWLSFTDLVFIDPIGTGFSRGMASAKPEEASDKADKADASDQPTDKADKADEEQETKFWEVERDLKAIGEFVQRWLSRHQRWLSPVFIAGESYGGFRVAKLACKLQQEFGVGLSGAILISPALEFSLLDGGSDYNLTAWGMTIPSFAAAAAHHGLAQWTGATGDMAAQLSAAEQFARQRLIPALVQGDALPPSDRQALYQQLANLIGLPAELVEKHRGRIDFSLFARELLRAQQRVVGLYDASITAIDPFPDRLFYEGTDPTLDGLDRLFTGAINSHLRDTLGVKTDLVYQLLNYETFKAWKFDPKGGFKQGFIGAVDDLRIGMTLNPYMQVYITHGWFDLITPYFASNHLADLMKLQPEIRANLTLKHYPGGHMFYSWDSSRQAWLTEMMAFYSKAIS
jgi:carboxypeptidase C (cathepsin A)